MHVMTYHLWCSSNSLNDDSIQLCLFQKHLQVPLLNGLLSYREVHSMILVP